MWRNRIGCVCRLAVAMVLLWPLSARTEESAEAFFRQTKTIDLLIGSGAGSSYDTWARVVGKHWTKHLPGNPMFLVKAMPGAGSLLMANFLYNQAKADGSVVGSFSPLLPLQVVMGMDNAKLDPRRFGYIGSPESSDHVCVTTAASGFRTIDDVRKRQAMMGGSGATTVPSFMPPVINELTGTKFKVVEGYKSNEEVYIAMERREVDGFCSKLDSILRSQGARFASGEFVPLFTLNEERAAELPGVPSVFEYIDKPEERQMLGFIRAASKLGRPFAAPPGTPADRLELLRASFEKTMSDPEFLEELKNLKLELSFTSGKQLHQMVEALFKVPESVVKRAGAHLAGVK